MCFDSSDDPNRIYIKSAHEAVPFFWVVRIQNCWSRDTFRLFTRFGLLLTSLGRDTKVRHPSWDGDFQIYYVSLIEMAVRDVTDMVINEALGYCPTKEEREADEPSAMPIF